MCELLPPVRVSVLGARSAALSSAAAGRSEPVPERTAVFQDRSFYATFHFGHTFRGTTRRSLRPTRAVTSPLGRGRPLRAGSGELHGRVLRTAG